MTVLALAFTRLSDDFSYQEKGDAKDNRGKDKVPPEEGTAAPVHAAFDAHLIRALQETALAWFYINLTRDRIIGGVMQEYADGSVINVLESIGLQEDCPMSDFVRAWRGFTAEDSLADYDRFFDLKEDIALYRRGAYSVSLSYKTVNAKMEETWAKQTMLFSEDLQTKDVIAYCYANDLTIEMQRRGADRPAEEGVIVRYHDNLSEKEESPLIKVLKETALIYFDINLSENRIVGGITQSFDDGSTVDVLHNLGLQDDCAYTAFIEAWRAFVDEQFLSAYDDFFDAAHLIDNFHNGIVENSFIYKTFNARGEDLWAKQTLLLSEEEGTGDVLAFVYAHDVTIEMEREGGRKSR